MDKNFDDLIIEDSSKSERLKKILLRVIALVILFLVVMITMKLLNGGDEEQLFPAEPNGEFENIPVGEQKGGELDEFEALKQQMKGEGNASESNATFIMPLPSSEYNATITPEKPTTPAVQKPSVPAAQKPAAPVSKPADKPASKAQKPATKPATQKPAAQKPTTTKPSTPAVSKPATQKPAATSGEKLAAGTYVQVYSVAKLDTKSRDIKKIEQNGYKYTTRKGGESIKVLIGPFDADELNAELAKIRANINKDAFVVRVK